MSLDKFEAIRAKGTRAAKPALPQPAPPPPAKPPKKPAAPPPEAFDVQVLADVTEKPVNWLWRGRVPFAMVTVLDGNPGVGKSGIVFDLAGPRIRRLSTWYDTAAVRRQVDGG